MLVYLVTRDRSWDLIYSVTNKVVIKGDYQRSFMGMFSRRSAAESGSPSFPPSKTAV